MFVTANGINVHVRVDGPPGGTPLVMVHSLGTSSAIWDEQAAALAGSFRVIRPDLRGHGFSACPPGPYSMELLADDLAGVLDALKIHQTHLAGISIGGMVAQVFAAKFAARVASLILVDTAMVIPTARSWHERAALVRAEGTGAIADAVMGRWVTPGFSATPAAEGLRAQLLRTPAEGYAAAAEAIARADLTESTSARRVPALIVVGEHDVATPVKDAQALHVAIPGSSLVVIAGGAHIPTVERPAEVTAAIRNFLTPQITDWFEAGMAVRREVLGVAHVERATAGITDMDRDFQAFITRTAWGSVWTRPGLDRRTRSLLTIAMMASLGHEEELKLHLRASRNTGASAADIAEALMQVAVYAGVPAANAAFRAAKEILGEVT